MRKPGSNASGNNAASEWCLLPASPCQASARLGSPPPSDAASAAGLGSACEQLAQGLRGPGTSAWGWPRPPTAALDRPLPARPGHHVWAARPDRSLESGSKPGGMGSGGRRRPHYPPPRFQPSSASSAPGSWERSWALGGTMASPVEGTIGAPTWWLKCTELVRGWPWLHFSRWHFGEITRLCSRAWCYLLLLPRWPAEHSAHRRSLSPVSDSTLRHVKHSRSLSEQKPIGTGQWQTGSGGEHAQRPREDSFAE